MPEHPLTKKQRNQHGRLTKTKVAGPWWESPRVLGGGAAVIMVGIIVVIALVSRSGTGTGTSGSALLPTAVVDAVTKPNASLFEAVGRGGQPGHLAKLPGTTTVTGANGKPLVVYVGAEFCPFCAGERWTIAMALARFGSFTGLHESTSSSTDAFPNTSTLTFHESSYSSQWVSFEGVELQDRNSRPLESPSAQVAQIFTTFDQPPYTGAARGFPFLDVAGRFVLAQTSFSPGVLQGKSWEEIGAALANPADPISQAIVGNANFLTASICAATGNQPAAVCNSAVITPIEQALNAQSPVAGAPAPSP